MSDTQNPSLPDLMLPEYTPDPELLAREKAIYDRIMKSPSQRAKERTAEMWEERYGVKPESGKLRRIFAGLGEVARGIGAGAKYQSIPDMAREEALKEYQAEVPNLNRELATISAQKRASEALAQKDAYQQKLLEHQQFVFHVNSGMKRDELKNKFRLTDAQIDKLDAETGNILAKTEGVGLTNDAQRMKNFVTEMFGGVTPTGDLANSFALNNLGRKKPEQASDILGLMKLQAGLKAAARGTGAGGGVTYDRVSTTRPHVFTDDAGRSHILQLPVERIFKRNLPGPPVDTNLSTTPGISWLNQAPAVTPKGLSQGEIFKNDKGETTVVPAVGQPYQSKPQPGNQITGMVDQSQIDRLSRQFGIAPEKFKNFRSTRYPDKIIPIQGKTTERYQARENYRNALEGLTKSAAQEYAKGNNENISGIWNSFENSIKAMTGDLPLEAINIRQQSVDLVATKILEMSGKAVTNQERNFLMKSLPNLTTDAPQTFVAKAMLLNHFMRTRRLFSEARLEDGEIERLYSTRAGKVLANAAAAQFKALDKLREMAANGTPAVIGGKVYKDYAQAAKVVASMGSAEALNEYFKQALKEANITDAIPLD